MTLPCGRARAADDPQGRPEAAAGDHPDDRGGRLAATITSTGRRTSRRVRATTSSRQTTGATRCWRRCSSPSTAAWSPTCRSACSCRAASILADRRPPRRGRAEGSQHLLDRLRGRQWREGQRVRVLRPHRQALRHRAPQDLRPGLGADARICRARSRRCRSRWSPTTMSASTCCRGRSPSTSRWCSPARAPTRSSPAITGIRRWPSANDPRRRLRRRLLRPQPRHADGPDLAGVDRATRTSAGTSSRTTSPWPARPTRSTRR